MADHADLGAVIRLHPSDNVVIASERLPAHVRVSDDGARTLAAIPTGHKVATQAIARGEVVLKYGQVIGQGGIL